MYICASQKYIWAQTLCLSVTASEKFATVKACSGDLSLDPTKGIKAVICHCDGLALHEIFLADLPHIF